MKKHIATAIFASLLCSPLSSFADPYDLARLSDVQKSQPIHAERLTHAFDARVELERLYPTLANAQNGQEESLGNVWSEAKITAPEYKDWDATSLSLRADESLAIDETHLIWLLNGTALSADDTGMHLSSGHSEPGLTLVQRMVFKDGQWQTDGAPEPISTAGTNGAGGSAFSIYQNGETAREWRFIELSPDHYGFFSESSAVYQGLLLSYLEIFDIQGSRITPLLSTHSTYDDSGYGKKFDWNDELTARALKARPSLFKGAHSIQEVYKKLSDGELDLSQAHALSIQDFQMSPNPDNRDYPDLSFEIVETYEINQPTDDGDKTIAKLPEQRHHARYRYKKGSYQTVEGHNPIEDQEM